MTHSEPVGFPPVLDLALPYYRSQGLRTVGTQMKGRGSGTFPCGLGDHGMAHLSSTRTFIPEQSIEWKATYSVCLSVCLCVSLSLFLCVSVSVSLSFMYIRTLLTSSSTLGTP